MLLSLHVIPGTTAALMRTGDIVNKTENICEGKIGKYQNSSHWINEPNLEPLCLDFLWKMISILITFSQALCHL